MKARLTAVFCYFAVLGMCGCTPPRSERAGPDPALQGRALLRQRDFDAAIRHLRSAIGRQPSRAELYPLLAEAKYETGEVDEAIRLCQESLELNPDLWDAQLLLWKLRLFKADWGDEERARVKKEIDEILARFDNEGRLSHESMDFIVDGYSLVNATEGYFFDGVFDYLRYDRYIWGDDEIGMFKKEFDKLLAPVDPEGQLSRGMRRYMIAGYSLYRGGGVPARPADIFATGGGLLQPPAKLTEALELYVERNPASMPWVEAAYASILEFYSGAKTGDDGKLRLFVEKWVEDMPEYAPGYYAGARAYASRGIEPEKSISYALKGEALLNTAEARQKWLREKPDPEVFNFDHTLAAYRNAVAWAYFKSGDTDKAREWLARALEASKEVADVHFNSGRIAEIGGDADGAISGYARALMLQDHPEAEKGLASVEQKRFDSRDALRRAQFACISRGEPTLFTDVTAAAGLVDAEGKPLKSGAVAWGDHDGDCFEDLLIDGRFLFRNKGDGTFENVSERAGLSGGVSAGGLWADFNNDGHLDFFAVKTGEKDPDTLWKNNSGTFENITVRARITDAVSAVFPEKRSPGQAAGWGDYDSDGFVDLYVANYERAGAPYRRGSRDKLFRNRGDGTFEEVLAGTGTAVPIPRCGRGVSWGDFNNDGRLDLYVANYRVDPNFLFVNRGGRFLNEARPFGVEGRLAHHPVGGFACWANSSGGAWGDYDNDGDLDLVCANLAHPTQVGFSEKTALYRNEFPRPEFTNVRSASGIKYEETHSQPAWCDYDNDGRLDLYITSVYRGRYAFLYRNKGDGTFEDATWLTGTRAENGWGCAWGDFDRDGSVDLAVASGSGIRLYRNTGNSNHWLHVKLVGKDCNRAAIGTRVAVIVAGGKQIREVEGGAGTASQNSLEVEFGLGESTVPVTVEIRWPCGKVQTLLGVTPDRKITISEE